MFITAYVVFAVCTYLKSAIVKVLLHVLGREGTHQKSGLLGELEIDSLHGLGPAHLLEGLGVHVLSVLNVRANVLDFVLVLLGLVLLPSADELGHELLDLRDLSGLLVNEGDLVGSLLLLLLLLGELHRHLNEGLLVLSVVGVPPTDVLVGGLLEVAVTSVCRD